MKETGKNTEKDLTNTITIAKKGYKKWLMINTEDNPTKKYIKKILSWKSVFEYV